MRNQFARRHLPHLGEESPRKLFANKSNMRITNLGFPNVYQSLIKITVEKFWKGEATEADVRKALADVEAYNHSAQEGLDLIPVGEIDLYDRMLATAVRFGIVPARFGTPADAIKSLATYLSIPRGIKDKQASPMVKWFNTNYRSEEHTS